MGFALSDMSLTSSAFANGAAIPKRHTGEAEDISPALTWSGIPEGTRSLAIFCHDPDAPLIKPGSYGFVHWLLYNIPATLSSIPEGTREGTSGLNDFGNTTYGGPMPPEGHGVHHYYFWLLALDKNPGLPQGLTLWDFLKQAEPHVTAMNRLLGTYSRS